MCGARPPADDASRFWPRINVRPLGVYIGIPSFVTHGGALKNHAAISSTRIDSSLTRPACLEMSTYEAARRHASATFGPYAMRPPSTANSLNPYIAGSRLFAASQSGADRVAAEGHDDGNRGRRLLDRSNRRSTAGHDHFRLQLNQLVRQGPQLSAEARLDRDVPPFHVAELL